jgi:hypothetical protein
MNLMMFSIDQLKASNGKTMSKRLFYELCYTDPSQALFTLKERDLVVRGKTMLSLQQLYLSLVPNDPTEYEFAMTLFGSWEVWQDFNKSPVLKPYIARWRKEAEIKVKSEAIKSIAEEMRSGGRSSFGAAKLLLERGWLDKEAASQAKRKLQEKEDEELDKEARTLLSEDAERLGIRVN